MKLWKENKLNQEWEMSFEKIIEEFKRWDFTYELRDLQPIDLRLRIFLTDKKGLNSAFEEEDFDKLFEIIEKEKIV